MEHKCECSLRDFTNRLLLSINNIKNKMEDKESNNLFFLTLYELPYIFCDGKVIAGFRNKIKTSDIQKSLIAQPLNTLHLTERVIEHDRFNEKILEKSKVKRLNDSSCVEFDIEKITRPDVYEVIRNKDDKFNLLNYLGFIEAPENKRMWGQYLREEKNAVKIYLYIVRINKDLCLYIFWSDGTSIKHSCLMNKHKKLSKLFKKLFKEEITKQTLKEPLCMKKKKKDLKETIDFESIEKLLYSREYLDKTLDNVTDAIYSVLGIKKGIEYSENSNESTDSDNKHEAEGLRCVFLRTKKPDVNYLVIHVTPKMLNVIYKKVIEKLNKEEFFIDKLIIPYCETYSNNFTKSESKPVEFKNLCTEKTLYLTYQQLQQTNQSLQEKSISIEKILSYHGKIANKKTLPSNNLDPLQKQIYYTVLSKNIIENTPLIAGVAYEVGKRGIPDFSVGWQMREIGGKKIGHPFALKMLKLDKNEQEIRYPPYFETFIDIDILKPEMFSVMIDIPVIVNGILFGVFIIYPPIKSDMCEISVIQERFPDILQAVERHKADMMRSFFLDVCANVTTILSGERITTNKDAPLDRAVFMKKAESLIKYAHNVPRTYITDVSGSDFKNRIDEHIKEIFKNVPTELLTTLNKLIINKNEAYSFYTDSDKLKLISGERENITAEKYNLAYKFTELDSWQFIILQLFEKPIESLSFRERSDALYLCQAIETGLRTLEKKYEIINHGTRAAVAAIMGRNMSHNIGSHVLSYLINLYTFEPYKGGLQKQIEELVENFSKDIANMEISENTIMRQTKNIMMPKFEKFIMNNRYLLEYLKDRMDFIATILTFVPSCNTLNFKKDILLTKPIENKSVLNYDIGKNGFYSSKQNKYFEPLSLILDYIAFSEKLKGSPISREKFDIKLSDLTSIDIQVAIPGGVVGKQAFYTILENIIRNAAKHGAAQSNEEKLVISINFPDIHKYNDQVGYDRDDLLRVTITDNLCSADEGLIKKLEEKCNGDIINTETGELERFDLGFKEMKIAAAFLRGINPTGFEKNEIVGWRDDGSKRLLGISTDYSSKNGKGNLQYSFFLLKPKEALIITDDARNWGLSKNGSGKNNDKLAEFKKEGIDFVVIGKSIDNRDLTSFDDFKGTHLETSPRHRFLVIDLDDGSYLKDLDFDFLPYRIIKRELLKDEIKEINNPSEFINKVYGMHTEKLSQDLSYKGLPKLLIHSSYYDPWANIEGVERCDIDLKNLSNKESLCLFLHHFGSESEFQNFKEKNSIQNGLENFRQFMKRKGMVAIEPITGSNSSKGRLNEASERLKYELIEASLTKVCIIDERFYRVAKDRNMGEILAIRGIDVYDLAKDDNGGLKLVSLNDESFTIKNLEEELITIQGFPSVAFLVLHMGIIDKIIEDTKGLKKNDVTSVEKVVGLFKKSAKHMLIHSGRGKTEVIPKGVRFLNYPELESWFYDDKYSLVQGLFSIRGR